MRYRMLLLAALVVVVASGAGPFRRSYGPVDLYPGVTGPGPGVVRTNATGMNGNCPMNYANGMYGQTGGIAQLAFQGVDGMYISWDTATIGGFDSVPLVCPGSQNFEMGKIYRLRLSNIPNRPDLVLYPTVEVGAVVPRTKSYLDHNAIPVKFTDNDFDQVQAGNFVTKVIFLPSPEFQNLAIAGGVDTIVNTQLPAGADPVVEAQNRGAVLAVIRIGNKALDLPGSYAEGMVEMSGVPGPVPQIPIAGVNIPQYGNPNTTTPYGVPGPAILPQAGKGIGERVFSPVNPMPATSAPGVAPNWSGDQF